MPQHICLDFYAIGVILRIVEIGWNIVDGKAQIGVGFVSVRNGGMLPLLAFEVRWRFAPAFIIEAAFLWRVALTPEGVFGVRRALPYRGLGD